MKFTTRLELHSQATRLYERVSYAAISKPRTGLSPSLVRFSKRLLPGSHAEDASTDYNSEHPLGSPISSVSYSRFTRRY
jgi:hypothetical protein